MERETGYTIVKNEEKNSLPALCLSHGAYRVLTDFMELWKAATKNDNVPLPGGISFTWTGCAWPVSRHTWTGYRDEVERAGFIDAVGKRTGGRWRWSSRWKNYTPDGPNKQRLQKHRERQERERRRTQQRRGDTGQKVYGVPPAKKCTVSPGERGGCPETGRSPTPAKKCTVSHRPKSVRSSLQYKDNTPPASSMQSLRGSTPRTRDGVAAAENDSSPEGGEGEGGGCVVFEGKSVWPIPLRFHPENAHPRNVDRLVRRLEEVCSADGLIERALNAGALTKEQAIRWYDWALEGMRKRQIDFMENPLSPGEEFKCSVRGKTAEGIIEAFEQNHGGVGDIARTRALKYEPNKLAVILAGVLDDPAAKKPASLAAYRITHMGTAA